MGGVISPYPPAPAATNWFNVLTYGADPTGAKDSTGAINAAIAAAAAAGGGTAYLPSGVYKTTAAIVFPQGADNVLLQGTGDGAGNTLVSPGQLGATIIRPSAGATYDAISTALPPVVGTAGWLSYGLGISDLVVDCSNVVGTTAGQGNGVHFYGVRYARLVNVQVFNSPNWAFLMEGDSTNYAYNASLTECLAGACAAGFRFTNCEQCNMYRCVVEGAAGATAASQPWSGSSPGTAAYMLYANVGWIFADHCTFGSLGTTTGPCVYIDNGETCTITGCLFDSPRGPAIQTVAGGHILAGNSIQSPCTAISDVAVKIGAGHHVITGNVFQAGSPGYTWCLEEFGAYVGNVIEDNQFVAGSSGTVLLNAGSTATVHHNAGYNPVGPVGPPAVPATTVAYVNTYGTDATVYIVGPTVSAVKVAGTTTGITTIGSVRVPAGDSIALTYATGTPVWTWFLD